MTMSRSGVVFLDTSVVVRYFLGDPAARDVVESGWRLAVNSVVFSEASFNLLRILYEEKHGAYRFYDMKEAVARRDAEVLRGYELLMGFLGELMAEDRLLFLPVTMEVVREAAGIATRYGLLPNDALIAATCRRYGVDTIASFDGDFRRIPWLRVIP